jgi:hypothetical protein
LRLRRFEAESWCNFKWRADWIEGLPFPGPAGQGTSRVRQLLERNCPAAYDLRQLLTCGDNGKIWTSLFSREMENCAHWNITVRIWTRHRNNRARRAIICRNRDRWRSSSDPRALSSPWASRSSNWSVSGLAGPIVRSSLEIDPAKRGKEASQKTKWNNQRPLILSEKDWTPIPHLLPATADWPTYCGEVRAHRGFFAATPARKPRGNFSLSGSSSFFLNTIVYATLFE